MGVCLFFDSDSRFSPNRIPAQVLKAEENMKFFDFIMHDECDLLGEKYLPEKNIGFLTYRKLKPAMPVNAVVKVRSRPDSYTTGSGWDIPYQTIFYVNYVLIY